MGLRLMLGAISPWAVINPPQRDVGAKHLVEICQMCFQQMERCMTFNIQKARVEKLNNLLDYRLIVDHLVKI